MGANRSFIASLTTAKVYSTPLSIDKLSEVYQEFYIQAESNIATHIKTLASRQSREASPTPSVSSKTSKASRLRPMNSRDTLETPERAAPEQQMLTPQEVSERRRARRLLEHKRLALEEAVERRVCEGIYDRIWRHKSALDEVRDEKLRSKTAALALVGIGLKDLGIEFTHTTKPGLTAAALISQVDDWISKAREGLLKMNDSRNPLGKLQNLAATHHCIVNLLSELHQSSSSADEILPTLIYTLITSPPEGINIISNLHFIQRFRSASKVDGEAAYCLTNLEAAITFLETVDLASLRSNETLEGPPKSTSRPSTPHAEAINPWTPGTPSSASLSSPATTPLTAVPIRAHSMPPTNPPPLSPTVARPSPPASPLHQRRLSSLFQPPASAFGAASDAVRTTADQGFKNISNTLDNSFNLLFGRLKEHGVRGDGAEAIGNIMVPKTLDDARKLVSPKLFNEEDGSISEASSFTEQPESMDEGSGPKVDDRLLDLIGGRKMSRDRSSDSVRSSSSSKRVVFAAETNSQKERDRSPGLHSAPSASPQQGHAAASNTAVESMRNLGNTLNPLNRLAGMNVMRGFGRSSPLNSSAPLVSVEPSKEQSLSDKPTTVIEPPIKRFLEVTDVGELRLGDVSLLLKDYQRLAGVLKNLGGS